MKVIGFLLGLMIAASAAVVAASAAHADDITAMISQYRREHGLPAVKTDAKLTAVAVRQAQAMAASGIMDHDVAGSFSSRIAGANTDSAAENIAAGTKTWADTLRVWKASSGHNANLLRSDADSLGVAVAHNENTRYKVYWAMVIGRTAAKSRPAPGLLRAASPDAPVPSETPRRSRSANTPGFLDSLGTALKRVTSPIRNLWN
jgi:uncharacterized protein YkwD